jgi:hypothetical protein
VPAATTAVRVGLPAAIAVLGAALLLAGQGALGGALLVTAFVVVLANLWVRLAIDSNRDRDDEAAARREFERTGRWPNG